MANGRLDTRTLAQIDGEPGDLLRADACGYWNALQRDFRNAMGYGLGVREAYRPLSVQIGYFVTRYTKTSRNTGLYYDGTYWVKKPGVPAAARPGTSKHGDGLAVDVNVDSFNSPAYRWLGANAGRYGFGNNQGRADGEPWHWVFGETRPTIQPADVGSTPIDNQEDDVQADERAALMEIRDNMPGRLNVHPDGDLWKKILHIEGLVIATNANIRGDVEALPGRILDQPIPRAGESNPDGTPRYTTWRDWVSYTQLFANYARGGDEVNLDEAELGKAIAEQLAPIVAASLGSLPAAQFEELKQAVLDEAARKLTA